MRRAAKVDESQGGIVSALRAAGARVKVLSHVGGGVPDLLVTYHGRIYLLECKPDDVPSRRRLTTAELEFAREHPVAVVWTPAMALEAIGLRVAA